MAEKLGFEGIHYLNHDGRKLKDHLDLQFEKILLDAPCSGLGVIGRKPDLKFHIKPESLDELQKLQYELLESMMPLLKEEGILVYSTCTLNKKENGKLIARFLKEHESMELTRPISSSHFTITNRLNRSDPFSRFVIFGNGFII